MNMPPEQIGQKLAEQLQAGQFNSAAKLAKRAFKTYPKIAHFANVAGTALANAEQGREALQYFQKALKLEPGHEEYQNNLVHAYIVVNQHDRAEALGLKLLDKRKEPSKLLHLLAFSAELTGQQDKIVEYTTKGLETATSFRPQLLVMRGDAYSRLEDYDLAEQDFQEVVRMGADNDVAVHKLVQLYLDTFRVDLAQQTLDQLLAQQPDTPAVLVSHADILLALGKIDEAKETLYRVRKLDPDQEQAIIRLANIATPEERPQLIEAAKTAMSRHAKGTNSWCRLALSVGNLYFSEKDYKAAGSYLTKANAGLAHLFLHAPGPQETELTQILQRTPPGPADLRPIAHGRPKPIFVLGQPRSGTTLTEMILTAHPDVTSCGELSAIKNAYHETFSKDEAFDPQIFADTYFNRIPEHGQKATAIVDKMPANYRFLGLMLHAIPGAKIIHIERDPREVALSMWRQHFKSDWMRFTNSFKHMAMSANRYRRYMNHWKSEFEGQFLTINYSDMVGDVEKYSKEMAAFCDLEWVPEMTAPQKNKAQVRTASVTQVRQGVHKKSVGGWRVMEHEMRDFIRNLDKDIWPELDF